MSDRHVPFAFLLALVWGAIWAAYLQFSRLGQYLADQRTWVTVVVGIGGDLAIARLVVPRKAWERLFIVITLSSIPIITRSLYNEWLRDLEVIDGSKE